MSVEQAEREAASYRRTCQHHLGLRQSLHVATRASRSYRSERENVFLAALDVTLQRNAFHTQMSAGGKVGLQLEEDKATWTGSARGSTTKLWQDGVRGSVTSLTDLLREISLSPLKVAQSILSANFTIPLLRGSNPLVVRESLTQSEHNLFYALRDYARFQQTFTVDVATRYYRILQLKDIAENERKSEERLRRLVEVQADKATAGRIAPFQVDQARQDVLRAQDRVQGADADFLSSLDDYKLELSVPITAALTLDQSELARLRDRGLQGAPFSEAAAIPLACRHRLDLRNERDRERDAKRHVLVARDGVRAQFDLTIDPTLGTQREQPFNLFDVDPSAMLELDLDLPLERTQQRNAWRRACLAAVRARRARERTQDLVVLQVRDAFRRLHRARRSHEIQQDGVRVAERRVESTEMHLERGTASIRDRLEAEASLVQARNALTRAFVDHAIARLALLRDVGILRVDAEGGWQHIPPSPQAASDAAPPMGQAAMDSATNPMGTSNVLPPPPAGSGSPATPIEGESAK